MWGQVTMNLSITRCGETIVATSNFTDPKDRGEVAHFLAELEVARKALQSLWEGME